MVATRAVPVPFEPCLPLLFILSPHLLSPFNLAGEVLSLIEAEWTLVVLGEDMGPATVALPISLSPDLMVGYPIRFPLPFLFLDPLFRRANAAVLRRPIDILNGYPSFRFWSSWMLWLGWFALDHKSFAQ